MELAALLHAGDAVLDFAAGGGRNTAYLRAQGYEVDAISDADAPHFRASRRRYQGAITTHGLLHGTPETIAASIAEIADALAVQAPLYGTFASVNDPRFGDGERLGEATFAPTQGEECGIPHTFFDEAGIRGLLDGFFTIASIEEHAAEHIAGSVHWFVRARRR